MYNLVLTFTSFDAKVDELVTRNIRPYLFCIQGELYHKIGSMCLAKRQCPQFAQLYIHDTESKIQNHHVVTPLLGSVVDNVQYQSLEGAPIDLKLRLITSQTKDACRYNVSMADEVVALMVGNGSKVVDKRDVVIVQ